MSELRESLEQYLAIRRSLGFELKEPARLLRNFVAFAQREDASFITTQLALRWAKQPAEAQPATWATRLAMVRRFAAWCSATDHRTEIPPEGLLPHRYRRKPPYIYSDDEIECIVETAAKLASSKGLRARTYSTLFALLAVTGMRVSEALSLNRKDVDLERPVAEAPEAEQAAHHAQMLGNAMEVLERALDRHDYLVGPDFSAGDIPLGIVTYRWLVLDIARPRLPNLEAWSGRLQRRAAFRANIRPPEETFTPLQSAV